jgi:hypothetical protein
MLGEELAVLEIWPEREKDMWAVSSREREEKNRWTSPVVDNLGPGEPVPGRTSR